MNQELNPAAVREIERLLEHFNVIQAIKVYRMATGCGLKDVEAGVADFFPSSMKWILIGSTRRPGRLRRLCI